MRYFAAFVDSMKVNGGLATLVAVVLAPKVNGQTRVVLPAQGPPVQLPKRPVVGRGEQVIEGPDAKLAVHLPFLQDVGSHVDPTCPSSDGWLPDT
jgi:hypothetical protein